MDLAIELGNGKYRMKAKLSNDPTGCAALYAWLCTHAQPDSWVVMEATGIYHQALAEFLYAHGYRVCVLNPAQVALDARSQLQRGKTDRSDAKLIASYISRTGSARLRAGLYMPAWWPCAITRWLPRSNSLCMPAANTASRSSAPPCASCCIWPTACSNPALRLTRRRPLPHEGQDGICEKRQARRQRVWPMQ